MVNVTAAVGVTVLLLRAYAAWFGKPDTSSLTGCGLPPVVMIFIVILSGDPPSVITDADGALSLNVNGVACVVPEMIFGGLRVIVTSAFPWTPWLLVAVSVICTEPVSVKVISASQYPVDGS